MNILQFSAILPVLLSCLYQLSHAVTCSSCIVVRKPPGGATSTKIYPGNLYIVGKSYFWSPVNSQKLPSSGSSCSVVSCTRTDACVTIYTLDSTGSSYDVFVYGCASSSFCSTMKSNAPGNLYQYLYIYALYSDYSTLSKTTGNVSCCTTNNCNANQFQTTTAATTKTEQTSIATSTVGATTRANTAATQTSTTSSIAQAQTVSAVLLLMCQFVVLMPVANKRYFHYY